MKKLLLIPALLLTTTLFAQVRTTTPIVQAGEYHKPSVATLSEIISDGKWHYATDSIYYNHGRTMYIGVFVPQKHIIAMANKCDSVITYLRSTGMPDAQLLYIQLLLKKATTPLINDVWAEKRRVDSLKAKKP